MNVYLCILILSARQSKTNTFANNVDPSHIRIYTIYHIGFDFRLKHLFSLVGKSKFKNERALQELRSEKGLQLEWSFDDSF